MVIIICTDEEKEQLIGSMSDSGYCPFTISESDKIYEDGECDENKCEECVCQNFEWKILK